jgi:sugar diacid utilization regulator
MSTAAATDAGGRVLRALLDDEACDAAELPDGPDPDGPFCAAVSTAAHPRVWAPAKGWTARLETGATTWVLAQVSDVHELFQVAPAPAGVGSVRPGWEGARQSLIDAGLALGVARGRTASFAEDWVLATVFGARKRLAEVCSTGSDVATRSAHLADAVQAFADHRLSVVGAARALHVHPNTVIYRLERWHGLTGWDPRTFHGLASSVACLQVAR